jgi:hypothetical protein
MTVSERVEAVCWLSEVLGLWPRVPAWLRRGRERYGLPS